MALESSVPTTRDTMSAVLPGASGTTSRSGFAGKGCAADRVLAVIRTAPSQTGLIDLSLSRRSLSHAFLTAQPGALLIRSCRSRSVASTLDIRPLLLLLALAPAPAFAQTISNLASLPVFFTCLAQEQDLRQQFMAELRKRDPQDAVAARWEAMLVDSSWAACVRQKKWVSKAYCADLLEANTSGTRRDVARVMEKHWS